jgi:hypothetical protein
LAVAHSIHDRKSASLNPFALASLLLLCLALLLRLFQRRNDWRHADAPWPFYARKPLAGPEQVLYQRLVTDLPGYLILSGVPVSAVLGVRRGHNAQTWVRRLRHLQYDFVVCGPDATVLAAIQLEDSARSEHAASSAEYTIERASDAAGVRLLRWPARALPGHAEIRAAFALPLTQIYEEAASSANQSWWPSLSSARLKPPVS